MMRRSILPFGLIAALSCLLPGALAQNRSAEPGARELKNRYNALRLASMGLLEKFQQQVFTHTDGRAMPYRLFKPEARGSGKKYPLIVFLHGLGGKGSDNVRQMTDQIVCPAVWALPGNQAKHPCFVLAPQSSGYGKFMCWSQDVMPVAKALIDKIVREEPIDPDRICVTGLSMGGFGTWSMIAAYPNFFAAAVPVCGRGDSSKAPLIVKGRVSVWAFHGALDPTVKVSGSRAMIRALKEAGGNPRYTEYPDVKHSSWEGAYSDPKLIAWVFSQRRTKRISAAP